MYLFKLRILLVVVNRPALRTRRLAAYRRLAAVVTAAGRVVTGLPEGIPIEIEMRVAAGTGLAAEQDVQHIRKSQKQVHDKYDNEYQDCDDEPEEKFQDNHNFVL